jgi:hypothetical protein
VSDLLGGEGERFGGAGEDVDSCPSFVCFVADSFCSSSIADEEEGFSLDGVVALDGIERSFSIGVVADPLVLAEEESVNSADC